jgi:hypothetical protein
MTGFCGTLADCPFDVCKPAEFISEKISTGFPESASIARTQILENTSIIIGLPRRHRTGWLP